MSNTLQFAMDLIRRPSVTPDDAGCQQLLGERLAAAGFRLEQLTFDDVSNLWARHGDTGPVLCFAGHTDVVPAGDTEAWTSDPFKPEIRDGILYGRGAADMKASLAAMVDAAVQFVTKQPDHNGSIAFLITSDEEGRAQDGTKKVMEMLNERGESIEWCVIGEPSCTATLGDGIKVGRRGSLSGMLTVNGQQGHVAYPHLARNPIESFAPILAELYATKLDDGNEFFPPSSFQVVRISSDAGAVNVTPGTLTTRFNFRYSTIWTYQQLQVHTEKILNSHRLNYDLDWHLSGEPFFTPVGPIVTATREAVHEITGTEPELSTGGGTSDGRFIAPAGAQVVEFGAVNATIHQVNEQIPVRDVDPMRQVYCRIMKKMLA
jgi:succinyl-diaminopimelate desuccinylase